MAKAAVQKGIKINVYKLVTVKEPDAREKKKDPTGYETARGLNATTKAVNNLGSTLNGINKIVGNLKQIELDRLETANKNKPKMDPKYGKSKKGGGILGSLAKGFLKTGGGFLSGLLGLLGNLFKAFVVLPVLTWLSKEENQQKVAGALEVLAKFGKFIWDWASFGVTNTIDGLYKLLSDDSSWMDRLLGFGQAILGVGSIFIGLKGLKWLLNPVKVAKGITAAVKALVKFVTKRGNPLRIPSRRKGRAAGGLVTAAAIALPQMAQGGWITGPQSGYPVSLDGGKSTSFIGHGTEYVSQKSSGGAFVTPYDTPATRKNPGLTAMRQAEAARMGYSQGGEVKESLNLTADQFRALAYGVSGEAQRNTPDEYGTAAAILNRVADPRYPNNIMGVLSQNNPIQFAAYYDGSMHHDEKLQEKLSSQVGQTAIIAALRELKGRDSFKGTAMYKHMGKGDVKFSRRGNFYHYSEQQGRNDPPPSSIPTHYLRFIQNQQADPDQQPNAPGSDSGIMGGLSNALQGLTGFLSNVFLGGPASAAPMPQVAPPPGRKSESEANDGARGVSVATGDMGEKVFPLPKGRFEATARQIFGAPRDGGSRSHLGVDLTEAPPWGSDPKIPVVAAIAGSVLSEEYLAGQTYYSGLMVRGKDGHDQRYLHMEPSVKPGQEVSAGDQIGRLYDDGINSHLHFEVYKNGKGGALNPSIVYPNMFKAGTTGGGQMKNPTAFTASSLTTPGQNKPSQASIQSQGDRSRMEDTTFSGMDGIPSQFSAAKKQREALLNATQERDDARENFKTGVANAVMTAQTRVNESNQQSANAIQQANSGLKNAAAGGESKPKVNGSLPGVGSVNINGVLKTTAYALNSNKNFMRGILR